MGTQNKKILVIDDIQENVYSIIEWLKQDNYVAIPAYDGRTGIQIAKRENPDLILCDIMMPDINGYQVKEELSKEPNTSKIPFIFVSAKSELQDIRDGMQLGADDYITKPFTGKELLSTIRTRLGRKELYDKEINELRQSISYSLPHELQTPLTSIVGFSEILIDESRTLSPDKIEEIANDINLAAKRLDKIIQKVLLSVKLDLTAKDKEQVQWLRSSFTQNAKDTLSRVAKRIAEDYKRFHDLVLNIESSRIQITETNLRQIANELIDNAFKYSDKGDKIEITANKNENDYHIYVINEGRGLTEKQINQIGDFVQFNRLMYEQKGTGLGLSIAKKLVLLHGGKFSIDSIPDKKTLIEVILPIKNGDHE